MTYGAETWALTTRPCKEQGMLAAAQTKVERSMLNITYRDRKTNIWVREKTKVTDVIEQVRRRKWTLWRAHVCKGGALVCSNIKLYQVVEDADE